MPKCKNPACDYPASRDSESWDFCCEKCEGRFNGEEWASKGRKRHTAYCTSNRDGSTGDNGGGALFLDRNGRAGDSDDEDRKKRRGAALFDHPPLLGANPAAYGASWPGGIPPLPPPPLDGGNLQVFGTDGGMGLGAIPGPPGAMPSGNSGMAPDQTGGLGGAPEAADEADPIARMERAIMRSLSASETMSEVGNPAPLPPPPEGKAETLRSMMREEPTGMGDSTNNSQRPSGPRLWRPPPPRANPRPALPGIPPGAVPHDAGSSGSMQTPELSAPLPAAAGPSLPPEPVAQAPAAVPGVPRPWRPPIPGGGAIGVPRPWRPPLPGGRAAVASSSPAEPALSGIPPALRNMKALAAAAQPVSSRSVSQPVTEVAVKTDKLANSLRDKLMANRKKAAPETKQDNAEVGAGGGGGGGGAADYQQKIVDLEVLKKQAIEAEDYDEAKRLKKAIEKAKEEAELAIAEAAEQSKAAEENARKQQAIDNEQRSRRDPSPPARGPSPPARSRSPPSRARSPPARGRSPRSRSRHARGRSPPARSRSPPRAPSPAAARGPSPEAVRRSKESSEKVKAALTAEKDLSPLEIMAANARKAQDSQRVMADERLRKQLEKRDEKSETAVNNDDEDDEDDMF